MRKAGQTATPGLSPAHVSSRPLSYQHISLTACCADPVLETPPGQRAGGAAERGGSFSGRLLMKPLRLLGWQQPLADSLSLFFSATQSTCSMTAPSPPHLSLPSLLPTQPVILWNSVRSCIYLGFLTSLTRLFKHDSFARSLSAPPHLEPN